MKKRIRTATSAVLLAVLMAITAVTCSAQTNSSWYDQINAFRTKQGQWAWTSHGTKAVYNTSESNTLKPLQRDPALEKTAETRARELATKYSHTRSDGSSCFTAYPNYMAKGENIAHGQRSYEEVMEDWEEANESYSGQGHRRNLLDSKFNVVGTASFTVNGETYWVQCFGKK